MTEVECYCGVLELRGGEGVCLALSEGGPSQEEGAF